MKEKLLGVAGMPYQSQAQRRAFHAMESRGEISPATVKEFDQASKGKKLPERIHPAAQAGLRSFMEAHGAKFHKNAGRLGRRT